MRKILSRYKFKEFSLAVAVVILLAGCSVTTKKDNTITLADGPHLFLDDYLVASMTGLQLKVHSPDKYPDNPIITGANPLIPQVEKSTGPLTILRDKQSGKFRMWYMPHSRKGFGYHFGYATSEDGIKWQFPDLGIIEFQGESHNNLVVSDAIAGGVLFVPHTTNSNQRYKAVFYRHKPAPVGFSVAFSTDGLHWSSPEWIQQLDDSNHLSGTGASDIVNCLYDPTNKEFVAIFKMWSLEGLYSIPVKRGIPAPRCGRRIIGRSRSKDFCNWSKAQVCLKPDAQDVPTLEFYGLRVIRRGDLYIGFLPCLVDDAPPDGIGWTELAVSRDGDNWQRIRSTFLARSEDNNQAPDHAIAWVSDVHRIDNREYIYYNALNRGHKTGNRTGCLAFLRKNGFASLQAGTQTGKLLTKPVFLPQSCRKKMTLNADAKSGIIRVQLSDNKGVLEGYSFADCDPVTTDSVLTPVTWKDKSKLPDTKKALQIEFNITNAGLYGFSFQ